MNFYPLNLMFMKKIALKLTALSLSFLFSNITSAEELSAKQSLDKMTQALDNLNYELAFVQLHQIWIPFAIVILRKIIKLMRN